MLYDKDIREPLFMYFEEKYGKTRVFEEKRMGNSRADILIITEKDFIGIEIKSDADTYVRLSGQVKDYDRYCDYNYVVAGSTHGTHIGEHVPEYWGIITVEETEKGVDFYELRAPSKNPERGIDNKLAILWRQEMAHIQKLNNMHEYKRESKAFVVSKILEKVPHDILEKQICDELFERDYTTIAESIARYREENGLHKRRKKRISKRYKIK